MLTAATLSAAGIGGGGGGTGLKAGTTTATKTTPTPGQSAESDLKKAISIQLQNALKLVMSQNPSTASVASSRSTVTQDGSKVLTSSLRPQSAPVTPVKTPISSTVTSSPSKVPVTSSTLSPLKVGTVTCKSITAKVVASTSPRKNIGVGTNPPTSVVAVTLQAAKAKSSSPSLDGASKKSKLSAIETLLCEETISPKSSPGPAPSPSTCMVKDEVPVTPPDRASVKKAEVSKTEVEKRQPTEEGVDQKVEPPADSQKIKSSDVATGVSKSKSEPMPNDRVETKSVENIEAKLTDNVETKLSADKLSSQDLAIQKEVSAEASEKKPLPPSHVKTDAEAKPPAAGSSDAALVSASPPTDQITLEDSTQNQNVNEVTPIAKNEVVKAENTNILPANVEVSKFTNVEVSESIPPLLLAAPTAPEKEDITAKKGTRKRSPSPSLSESDQPPPAKKQAIELQEGVVVPSPSSITISGPPPLAQKQAIAAHKDVVTPPTSVSDLPPPAKKLAIEPQKDIIPSVFTSTTTAPFSTPTTTTTAQASIPITATSTVTVTVLGSSMDMGTQRATPGFDIAPPSQLPTEVNTDSLIQSLCSDSTSFEDPPDVSVLASQLGIDSVDSPVFNLSGFLSLIQPDLSILTPEEQSSAIDGQLLGNVSSGKEQSVAISGQVIGDTTSSAGQKPPEEIVGESTASSSEIKNQAPLEPISVQSETTTTITSFPATPIPPVAVSSPLQPEVAVPIPSAPILSPTQELLTTPSTSAPPLLSLPVAESITTSSMPILSPVMFPEAPIPPRPLVLGIPTDTTSLMQAPPPPSLGTPITPTPLTPTPLTPLGEGLLDLADISSLVDESDVMEGISQDVYESIEKLVNLDEQSTNATWK